MADAPLTAAERDALIETYATGPARLRAAIAAVPSEALTYRPAPGEWSAHEIAVHCADSEANAMLRIRYLTLASEPLIVGYDQEAWAREGDYHAQPIEPALAIVDTVRASTAAFIRRLPDAAWRRAGRHTEYDAPYTADQWLRIYAAHLEDHAAQIEANVAAWRAANEPAPRR